MTLAELHAGLAAAHDRLTGAISGVTEEQFKRRPAATAADPDPWCIAELLAHLMATERLWAGRIALALREERATVTPSAPEAHEEGARAGRRAPVPQLIHGLLAARREVEKSLEVIDESALRRSVWHPRLNESLTVEWMVREKVIGHANEHAEQVERLRSLVGAAPRSLEDSSEER